MQAGVLKVMMDSPAPLDSQVLGFGEVCRAMYAAMVATAALAQC